MPLGRQQRGYWCGRQQQGYSVLRWLPKAAALANLANLADHADLADLANLADLAAQAASSARRKKALSAIASPLHCRHATVAGDFKRAEVKVLSAMVSMQKRRGFLRRLMAIWGCNPMW